MIISVRLSLLILLGFLALVTETVDARTYIRSPFKEHSAFRVHITKEGWDAILKSIVTGFVHLSVNNSIPTIDGNSTAGWCQIFYTVSRLNATNVKIRNQRVSLLPGYGLRVDLSADTVFVGNLRFHLEGFGCDVFDMEEDPDSYFVIPIANITWTQEVRLTQNKHQAPFIALGACNSSANVGEAVFKGENVGGFENGIVSSSVKEGFEAFFEMELCYLMGNLTNKTMEPFFDKLQPELPLLRDINISIRLINGVVITKDAIELGMQFFPPAQSHDKKADLFTRLLEHQPDVWQTSSRHISFKLHTSVVNSLTNGLLNALSHHQIIPSETPFPDFFNTTCKGFCLGKLIPGVSIKYPNKQLAFRVKLISFPFLETRTGETITAQVKGEIAVSTVDHIQLIKVNVVTGSAALKVRLKGVRINIQLQDTQDIIPNVRVKLTDSVLDKESTELLEISLNHLAKAGFYYFVSQVKARENYGFKLPTFQFPVRKVFSRSALRVVADWPQTALINSQLEFINNLFEFGTDIMTIEDEQISASGTKQSSPNSPSRSTTSDKLGFQTLFLNREPLFLFSPRSRSKDIVNHDEF